jgi:hypothetical protein
MKHYLDQPGAEALHGGSGLNRGPVCGRKVFERGTAIQKNGKRGWRLIDPDGKRFKAALFANGALVLQSRSGAVQFERFSTAK